METNRLMLRNFKLNETDVDALFSILSDKMINKYFHWYPLETKEQAVEYYHKNILAKYEEKSGYYFAICLKGNPTPIGYVAVSGDDRHNLSYALKQEFWGQGIATEACKVLLGFLKSTNMKHITARHDIENTISGKILQKIGLAYKYSYKERWELKNMVVTLRLYQLNFDDQQDRVYMGYWDKFPEHFIEDLD